MSIEYCKKCDSHIDTDFNAEHFSEEVGGCFTKWNEESDADDVELGWMIFDFNRSLKALLDELNGLKRGQQDILYNLERAKEAIDEVLNN